MATDLYRFPHFKNAYVYVKHMKIAHPSVHQYDCVHATTKETEQIFMKFNIIEFYENYVPISGFIWTGPFFTTF